MSTSAEEGWDELRLDRLTKIRASRRDALTGLRVSAKCERYRSPDVDYIGWIIYHSAPDNVENVLENCCFSAGFTGGKRTVHFARQKLRWFGEGTYFPMAHDTDARAAMRRLAADLSVLLAAKYAGTLFRVLRRRAFCSAIRARVRAKLISRSPSFGGLPDVLILDICRRWLR